MAKRGRKKGSKNYSFRRPGNFAFWKLVLSKPEEVNAFLNRGNDRQKGDMKRTLLYIKKIDKEFFNKINGKEILEKLK